jgi:hypothetical protein
MRLIVPAIVLSLSASSCVPSSSAVPPPPPTATRPLTATEEKAVASHQEQKAGVLERQGEMADDTPQCGPAFSATGLAGTPGTQCLPTTRPAAETAEDGVRAHQLRDSAKQHRRVAMALETATSRVCAGLPDEDLAESPFAHQEDIVHVEVLSRPPGADGQGWVAGARVQFHALEAQTAGSIQHVVDCHIAIDHLLGDDIADRNSSPLAPRGATATVTALPHGYVIDVRSNDPEAAKEIVRRAMALRPPTPR